ncbi:Alpha/Beta hydrolase protein [Zopfochytrium polystomum]|nr:Alpha/Beta hydrolase protein [Zopfochytrium polystomum]
MAASGAAVLNFHVFNADASPAHPVLAIHGIQGHALRWRFLAGASTTAANHPVFPTPRTIVAVDLRGHGASTSAAPWSLAQHIRDLAATLHAYRTKTAAAATAASDFAVDLIGHSFGGFLSLHFWAAHPTLVRKIVLLDPALKFNGDFAASFAQDYLNPKKNSFDSVEQAALNRSRTLHRNTLAAAGCLDGDSLVCSHPAVQIDTDNNLEQFNDPFDNNAEKFRFRWSATAIIAGISELSEFGVPNPPRDEAPRPEKLLLVRANFEAYVRDDIIQDIKEAFGEDRTVVKSLDCGHMVFWDVPDQLADIVREFYVSP